MARAWSAVGACVLLIGSPGAAQDPLAAVVLDSAQAPTGWQFHEERRAESVEAIPEAEAAVRQQWSYRGDAFDVIYFLCPDLGRAGLLYEQHARALGASAIVVARGTVVVELHDAPREVWRDAAALLGFDAAQQRKLVPAALPAGWSVVREFLAPAEDVATAGRSLRAPVQVVLVQVVGSPHGPIRVNFLLCADAPSAERLYQGTWAQPRPGAFVTLDGPVVIELIAEDAAALLPTLEVIEAAPLLPRAAP